MSMCIHVDKASGQNPVRITRHQRLIRCHTLSRADRSPRGRSIGRRTRLLFGRLAMARV